MNQPPLYQNPRPNPNSYVPQPNYPQYNPPGSFQYPRPNPPPIQRAPYSVGFQAPNPMPQPRPPVPAHSISNDKSAERNSLIKEATKQCKSGIIFSRDYI